MMLLLFLCTCMLSSIQLYYSSKSIMRMWSVDSENLAQGRSKPKCSEDRDGDGGVSMINVLYRLELDLGMPSILAQMGRYDPDSTSPLSPQNVCMRLDESLNTIRLFFYML